MLGYLNVERFRLLIPAAAVLRIDRHEIPGVRGINFVIHGFLEQGTVSSTLVDFQAKGLGEDVVPRQIPVSAFLLGRSAEENPSAESVGTLEIEQRSAITG